MALTAPAKQTLQQHCPLYPGLVCAWGGDTCRQRVTYQSPTRPTCRGAFRYGYRCQEQGEAEVSGADGAGCFPTGCQPQGVPAQAHARGCPCAHSPSTSSTFRKALFSRAFMITGGMAGAEGKEMSSQCSQHPCQPWNPVPRCQGPAAALGHGWRRGYSPMAGAAMPMRDTTTWKIAFWAAAVDSPRRFPFSSVTGIPSLSSLQGEEA